MVTSLINNTVNVDYKLTDPTFNTVCTHSDSHHLSVIVSQSVLASSVHSSVQLLSTDYSLLSASTAVLFIGLVDIQ